MPPLLRRITVQRTGHCRNSVLQLNGAPDPQLQALFLSRTDWKRKQREDGKFMKPRISDNGIHAASFSRSALKKRRQIKQATHCEMPGFPAFEQGWNGLEAAKKPRYE